MTGAVSPREMDLNGFEMSGREGFRAQNAWFSKAALLALAGGLGRGLGALVSPSGPRAERDATRPWPVLIAPILLLR